jgi:prevent-host-death family protein
MKPLPSVDIHEARGRLSTLVDRAANGDPFVITVAGKPVVKVCAIDAPRRPQRLGFMAVEIEVPEDFDQMLDWDAFFRRT